MRTRMIALTSLFAMLIANLFLLGGTAAQAKGNPGPYATIQINSVQVMNYGPDTGNVVISVKVHAVGFMNHQLSIAVDAFNADKSAIVVTSVSSILAVPSPDTDWSNLKIRIPQSAFPALPNAQAYFARAKVGLLGYSYSGFSQYVMFTIAGAPVANPTLQLKP